MVQAQGGQETALAWVVRRSVAPGSEPLPQADSVAGRVFAGYVGELMAGGVLIGGPDRPVITSASVSGSVTGSDLVIDEGLITTL
ncbi:hypothetical protein OG369_41295 [Streptomyces sp. NBC_01221]|uniref:hypothetical protein n=1 Tax=Streptomyces sp. NBC_01221 TaxID=2903782 RepID=UPI00224CD745|nr:hypothetical protein [Streptomyces sp. NBC_01221]MCX4792241.1 hypothetical protein [Streptomyces sp. NBC_01221]